MTRRSLLTLALMFALAVPLTLRAPHAQAAASPVAADGATARVIVKFKPGSPVLQARRQALAVGERHVERAQALGQRVGMALTSGASVSERAQVVFARGIDSASLAKRLAAEADVEYAVVDQRRHVLVAPNDPLYPPQTPLAGNATSGGPDVGQWYLRAPSGAVKSSIDVEPAWLVTTGSPNIVVAVLDTGVRFDHVDLQPVGTGGKLLPGYDMISDLTTANDGDGRDADPSDPGDAVGAGACGAGDPAQDETSSWHGTQTAGLIGALTNNGIGMASVGRDVRILPVRVLGKCGGFDSDIVAGIRWAAGLHVDGVPDNPTPARVINMSLGSDGACDANTGYPDAINEVVAAGVVVVASAGNSAGHDVAVPANCPGVIAVAGLRHVGTKVGFSDIGPAVALSAPAGNCINTAAGQPCLYPILTTSNSGTTAPIAGGSIYTDSFNRSVGTSFSAPLVAGTAALMLSTQPLLSPASVRALLRSTARPFPTTGGTAGITPQCHAPNTTDQDECYCTTTTCGAGMLDAGAAVLAAAGVQAVIGVTPAVPVAGSAITLSASGSLVAAGHAIVSYQWALTDNGGIVTAFGGATNASTATLTPTAAGIVTVSLTVTDDAAHTSSVSRTIAVAAVAVKPLLGGGGGGGGGGGALGAGWLLMLAAAVAALRRSRSA